MRVFACVRVSVPWPRSHRGVFTQLTERRKGLLVSLADLLYDGLQLGCHLVALCQLRLGALLLLLVPVVPNGWARKRRRKVLCVNDVSEISRENPSLDTWIHGLVSCQG